VNNVCLHFDRVVRVNSRFLKFHFSDKQKVFMRGWNFLHDSHLELVNYID